MSSALEIRSGLEPDYNREEVKVLLGVKDNRTLDALEAKGLVESYKLGDTIQSGRRFTRASVHKLMRREFSSVDRIFAEFEDDPITLRRMARALLGVMAGTSRGRALAEELCQSGLTNAGKTGE